MGAEYCCLPWPFIGTDVKAPHRAFNEKSRPNNVQEDGRSLGIVVEKVLMSRGLCRDRGRVRSLQCVST